MSIPNLITLARILLVPVVVWAIATGQMYFAFLLFLAAGISDAVDGFLAKRFGMKTELGAYLDPLADKVLIVSIYVALRGGAGAGQPDQIHRAPIAPTVLRIGPGGEGEAEEAVPAVGKPEHQQPA